MRSHFIHFFDEIDVESLSDFVIKLGGFKDPYKREDYWLFHKALVNGKWVRNGVIHVSYIRTFLGSDYTAKTVKENFGIDVQPEEVRMIDVSSLNSNRHYEFERYLCEQLGRFVKGIVYMELAGNPQMNFHESANIVSDIKPVDTIVE